MYISDLERIEQTGRLLDKAHEDRELAGTRLLDDVSAYLARFVSYPSSDARIAHTLWIAHTHLMEAWESTPRLAFLSPEPASGKTRALELTETLVPRAVESVNCTPAYLFRKVSDPDGLPTILYDEIDTLFGPKAKDNEEVRGVLNAGHRRGATAGRCVVKGKTVQVEELPCFCAVAIAGLGNLPDTILTRSVVIRMRRRSPAENVEPYRRRVHAPEGYGLRERLGTWAEKVSSLATQARPDMPQGIEDRAADVWESLLAVADIAGGAWPANARKAAVTLVTAARDHTPSLGIRLLGDLRIVFADHEALPTEAVINALCGIEEAPWADLRGKALDARRLANYLKPYGVGSKVIRIGEWTHRGYSRADFWDAWTRYLASPQQPAGSVTSVTPETDPMSEPADVTPVTHVTHSDVKGGDEANGHRRFMWRSRGIGAGGWQIARGSSLIEVRKGLELMHGQVEIREAAP